MLPEPSLTAAVADLSRRVALLERRRSPPKRQMRGRVRTRRDKTPYGTRPSFQKPDQLMSAPDEIGNIATIIELHNAGWGPVSICRKLDELGRRRRGKSWRGAHSLVKTIIERAEAAATAAK